MQPDSGCKVCGGIEAKTDTLRVRNLEEESLSDWTEFIFEMTCDLSFGVVVNPRMRQKPFLFLTDRIVMWLRRNVGNLPDNPKIDSHISNSSVLDPILIFCITLAHRSQCNQMSNK